MESHPNHTVALGPGVANIHSHDQCSYLIFHFEAKLGEGIRTFLYFAALAYCFIGLSAITARFFKSMESVVSHTRRVERVDPITNAKVIKHEKVWNYAIADISLLAFGTSFPQISLATIDALRHLGSLEAGGLGPGTLVGSAAFDLFPIHAICVVVPKAGELKKISDVGVWLIELFWSFWAYIWLYIILEVSSPNVITLWESLFTVLQYALLLINAYAQDKHLPYLSLPMYVVGSHFLFPASVCTPENGEGLKFLKFVFCFRERSERPEEWVPPESALRKHDNNVHEDAAKMLQTNEDNSDIVDIFSIHSGNEAGPAHQQFPSINITDSSLEHHKDKYVFEESRLLKIWKQQFVDALTVEDTKSRKSNMYLRIVTIIWQLILAPWRLLFAFVPPYHIAHGWIAFICSLTFISGIAYVLTKVTDKISCVTGINPYVIAFTALAGGTSWPDLVASKIAAERQLTADSAIANITCSNSVNIYVGIGVPWLINTVYNFFAYNKPLRIQNAHGLSFSLLIFFSTSVCCIGVLVLRRFTLGAELGGPRVWAWLTCVYLMLLWLVFVVLSSLKVSGII